MLPTTELMGEWFTALNAKYFNGSLPMPEMVLSRSRTRLGYMKCVRGRGILSSQKRDYSIHLSIYYDCDERQYQNVMLHEMIHYYISYKELKDTSTHGRLFSSMAERFNSDGWHITTTEKCQGWKVRTGLRRPKMRLLLLVETRKGERYLSVVNPRYAITLERQIEAQGSFFRSRQWYVSADQRFESWREVRSMRGRLMTDESMKELEGVIKPVELQSLIDGKY